MTSLPLDGFAALVAHEHLAKYEPCHHFAAAKLAQIVDRLVFLVFQASSLAVSDPARHYAPLSGVATIPETMIAKRIPSQVVALAVRELTSPSFRYLAGLATLQPTSPQSWSILRRKMARGGFGWQSTLLRISEVAARRLCCMIWLSESSKVHRLTKDIPDGTPPPASSFILIDKEMLPPPDGSRVFFAARHMTPANPEFPPRFGPILARSHAYERSRCYRP